MNKEKVFAWIENLIDMANQSDRYFVERTELYKENQAKDKEIERLSKEVDIWNKKYNEQFDIINELEKYLKENYVIDNPIKFKNDLLDKLKALKEGK